MPARVPTPQVSARIGEMIIQVAAAMGADAGQLIAGAGFHAEWLGDPDARISLAMEERLWNLSAELTGDPLFGLHAAAAIRPGAFDVLDYAVRTAPDLRTALQRLARYNRLVHDVAGFEIVVARDEVRIVHRFEGYGAQPCRHAAEFTLASLVVVAAQISGQPVRARAVEFAHGNAGSVDAYTSVFGVAPRFGEAASCLVLATDVVDLPVPNADPGLSRIVTSHAEQLLATRAVLPDSVSLRVRRQLASAMPHGESTLRHVAEQLNLSERSLQRRLNAESTTFADLLDEVRRELALRYVADEHLALGEVAYLLGFAEPSAFHRAFKRWTGTTPAAARRARRPQHGLH
jgi:AraC-like DNA-binding protein